MSGQYRCACLYTDNYVTIIGSAQLLAFVYSFARFTCFVKYYWVPDFIFATAYLARCAVYIRCHLKKRDLESRQMYSNVQMWSSVALAIGALVFVSMKWAEWSHFPTWPFLNWFVFLAIVNAFNTYLLRNYSKKDTETDALIYTAPNSGI